MSAIPCALSSLTVPVLTPVTTLHPPDDDSAAAFVQRNIESAMLDGARIVVSPESTTLLKSLRNSFSGEQQKLGLRGKGRKHERT